MMKFYSRATEFLRSVYLMYLNEYLPAAVSLTSKAVSSAQSKFIHHRPLGLQFVFAWKEAEEIFRR